MTINYGEAARLIRAGRRAERRSKALKKFIVGLIGKMLADLIYGWYLMLAVGIAHAEWLHKLPTIGFWWAVLLVVLVRPLLGSSSTNSETS